MSGIGLGPKPLPPSGPSIGPASRRLVNPVVPWQVLGAAATDQLPRAPYQPPAPVQNPLFPQQDATAVNPKPQNANWDQVIRSVLHNAVPLKPALDAAHNVIDEAFSGGVSDPTAMRALSAAGGLAMAVPIGPGTEWHGLADLDDLSEAAHNVMRDLSVDGTTDVSALGHRFAILSGEQGHLSSEENLLRTQGLAAILREGGHEPIPVYGQWKNPATGQLEHERSFLIPNMGEKEARRMGARFGQQSVITEQGEHDIAYNTTRPFRSARPPISADEPQTILPNGKSLVLEGPIPGEFGYHPGFFPIKGKGLTPEPSPVRGKAPTNPTINFEHYSPQTGLTELNPQMMGAEGGLGVKGERARASRGDYTLVPRSYAYVQGGKPEDRLVGLPKYAGSLPSAKVADIASMPDIQQMVSNNEDFERALISRGYAGYRNTSSAMPHALALFEKTPIDAVTEPAAERITHAAIRTPDGRIFTGANHGEAFNALEAYGKQNNSLADQWDARLGRESRSYAPHLDEGYLTTSGRYVGREEGLQIAKAAQQTREQGTRGIAELMDMQGTQAPRTIPRVLGSSPENAFRPAPVYHGTFADIDLPTRGDIGVHFGTREQALNRMRAKLVAPLSEQELLERGKVIKAYPNTRYPFHSSYDANAWESPAAVRGALVASDLPGARATDLGSIADERDLVRKAGYDSIDYPNAVEGPGLSHIYFSPEHQLSKVPVRQGQTLSEQDVRGLGVEGAHHLVSSPMTQQEWVDQMSRQFPGYASELQGGAGARAYAHAQKKAESIGPLSSFERINALAHSATGQETKNWYAGWWPKISAALGDHDADMLTRFSAILSAQKSPSEEARLALRAFDQYQMAREAQTGRADLEPDWSSIGTSSQRQDQLTSAANDLRWAKSAPKTSNYYLARRGSEDAVTIDRHIAKAYREREEISDEHYPVLAARLRHDAARAGVNPRDYQAMVWGGQTGYPYRPPESFFAEHLASGDFGDLLERNPGLRTLAQSYEPEEVRAPALKLRDDPHGRVFEGEPGETHDEAFHRLAKQGVFEGSPEVRKNFDDVYTTNWGRHIARPQDVPPEETPF